MRGTAAETPEQNKYEFDAQGYLVREENEDDAAYQARVADVLYKEGMSPNHPDDVAAQYDDPEPPPLEEEEGESAQDFQKRVHEQKEEWGKKNAEKRKEALEKEKQAEEERQEARKKLRKEQGFEDDEQKDWDRKPESERRESMEQEKKRDQDLDHDDEEKNKWENARNDTRVRQEAHATERSKHAEERSRQRGPQPQEYNEPDVVDVMPGPHTGDEVRPRPEVEMHPRPQSGGLTPPQAPGRGPTRK